MQEPDFPTFHQEDEEVASLKIPPHTIVGEQSVLGGLLLDNSAWDQVADCISDQDFYRHDHRLIFDAIRALTAENQPFDVITLSEWLKKNNKLEEVGGLAFLANLVKETPSAANIKAYANIVRERSMLRQMIEAGTNMANAAYQPQGRPTTELLDMAEQQVFRIAEQGERGRSGLIGIQSLLAQAVDRIDELQGQDGSLTGVPTGFTEFDEMTSGLQKSDLIIVAGRPSMGKTTFAMNIAENAAIKHGKAVAIFSMEMSGEQLAMRMMSSLGRVDQHKVRTGDLDDYDWPRITSAVGILDKAPLFIDDTPALSPIELRARARRLAKEHDLGMIVIDYLQLMQGSGKNDNRTAEISEISRSLKSLAKELNVPVVALSQLNRSLEQRPNKRPVMSDLRESGAIEQDADVIVFIYRDEVYNEESPDKGTAEIIISKQRNGSIGKSRLTFLGKYTRFENLAPGYYGNDAYQGGGHQDAGQQDTGYQETGFQGASYNDHS